LVSLEIGSGTPVTGTLRINWANGPTYIKTETDPAGEQLYYNWYKSINSVPYAYTRTRSCSKQIATIEQVLVLGNNANGNNIVNTGKIESATTNAQSSTWKCNAIASYFP
jgi:hypothetical protein